MKTYTIAQLERFKKPDIENIMKERGDLLLNLVSQILEGKKLKVFTHKGKYEASDDILFTLSNVKLKDPAKNMTHLKENNAVLFSLEIDVQINEKLTNDLVYNEEVATSRMNKIIEKFIDKKARVLWTVGKVEKQDKIEINLLFPDKLILPDIVLYNEYKEVSKKTKKQEKENYKQEFEKKLIEELEELNSKRFNIMKNDPGYFPEDREELMAFIKKSNKIFDKEALRNVIKKYNDDEEIITACIYLFNHSLFQHVSERLQNDRNFVLKIVDHDVNILEYASEKFRDDDEIMYKGINISGYIIRAASERLRHDKDFCLTAIKSQADAYGVIPGIMQEDNDLLMEAMGQRGELLMYSSHVNRSKELLLRAFSNAFPPQSRNLLVLTSEELRNDKEVALAAIKCNPQNIMEISQQLQEEIGNNDPIEYLTTQLNNTSVLKGNAVNDQKVTKSKRKFK